jgi:hypothetical protein
VAGILAIYVGDELILRKPHPCGANRWRVLRTGADLKLECAGCGHQLWLARSAVERRVKGFAGRGPRATAEAQRAAEEDPPAEPGTPPDSP